MLNIVTTYAFTGSGYVVPSATAKAGVLAMTRFWLLNGQNMACVLMRLHLVHSQRKELGIVYCQDPC